MAKRKKRNNIVQHRDWFYCRLRWYNQFGRQVECKVNLFTKNKGDAINRAKIVLKEIGNTKTTSEILQYYESIKLKQKLEEKQLA